MIAVYNGGISIPLQDFILNFAATNWRYLQFMELPKKLRLLVLWHILGGWICLKNRGSRYAGNWRVTLGKGQNDIPSPYCRDEDEWDKEMTNKERLLRPYPNYSIFRVSK
ncbi:hypothetical protein CC78DRAFT_588153 [Lojkania enalia]|uniref:Uncharacterized protein n=1 Tax=Lojkania enalia TaxID=147567 RepID=A0A9P4MUD3_9PLEO|nr:hypothetical protein CC78DRAFT_588153 [Didymosphaeria enalia]